MTKLKKAAFLVVARCLSSEEISGLRQLFKTIDTDGSGTITVDELKVCTRLVSCALSHHAITHTICLHFGAAHLYWTKLSAHCFSVHAETHCMAWNCILVSGDTPGGFAHSKLVTHELMRSKKATCSHDRRLGGDSCQYDFETLMGVSQLLI